MDGAASRHHQRRRYGQKEHTRQNRVVNNNRNASPRSSDLSKICTRVAGDAVLGIHTMADYVDRKWIDNPNGPKKKPQTSNKSSTKYLVSRDIQDYVDRKMATQELYSRRSTSEDDTSPKSFSNELPEEEQQLRVCSYDDNDEQIEVSLASASDDYDDTIDTRSGEEDSDYQAFSGRERRQWQP